MTFRTTVPDGLIVFNTHGQIPDGTEVELIPKRIKATRPSKKTSKKAHKSTANDPFLDLAGIWQDRPDWKGKTTLEIAAELRRKAMGDRNGRAARR